MDEIEKNKDNVNEVKGLKTKPLPIIIVLIAAGLSSVISIIQGQDFSTFFFRLLVSVLVFAFLGSLVKMVLDMVFNRKVPVEEEISVSGENAEPEERDGEVENINTDEVLDDFDEEPTEGDES